jgi:hypothetical protein
VLACALMYGKHFASMYTGSMFGKRAVVFAVWGYVIANLRPSRRDGNCYVELNPALLSAMFSEAEADVLGAIETLCSPDASSRTKLEDGRRLIRLDDHPGPCQYRVVNGPKYRQIRDEEERREYLREAQRLHRAKSTKSTKSTPVNRREPSLSQVEVEVEVEVEAENVPPAAGAAALPPFVDPLEEPAGAEALDVELAPAAVDPAAAGDAWPGCWSRDALEDVEAVYGGKVGRKAGRILAELADLKPLCRDWSREARPAWRRYLAATPSKFLDAAKFVLGFGEWSGKTAPAPTDRLARSKQNMAELLDYARRRDAQEQQQAEEVPRVDI